MDEHKHITRQRLARLSRREDGALAFMQIVGLIVGAVIAGAIAFGVMTSVRLGGDLSGMFDRDAQMNTLASRLQDQLTGATAIDVDDARAFTIAEQPSRRSAYYTPSGNLPDTCVTNRWELIGDGETLTLKNTQSTHAADSCESPVTSKQETQLTGLAPETVFSYENAYGRDLVYTDGAERGVNSSTNTRPEGLFENEWGYESPGFVSLDGAVNQAVGSTPLSYSARTPLKQLRPGVVSSDLGELGPPVIERTHLSGDSYRAHLSALTRLSDPRAIIQWSWRQSMNDGAYSSWSAWSTMDTFDQTVRQGAKWKVDAKYRVVLESRNAESETVTMTWVRPIAAPAAPTVAVALNPSNDAVVTVTPQACATGTTQNTRSRTFVNEGAWSTWRVQTVAPWTATFPVGQGARITAAGEARCVTPFAESDWTPNSGADATLIRPVTSVPTIDSIASEIAEDRGVVAAEVGACPAGTYYTAQWRYRLNEATAMTLTSGFVRIPAAASYNAAALREGDRIAGGITVRCSTPFASGPTVTRDSGWTVRPITTRPTITNVDASLGTAGQMRITGNLAACQSWMTYDARTLIQRDAETALTGGSWGATGTAFNRDAGTLREGSRFHGGIEARCATPYAVGPSVRSIDTAWNIRPITTPSTPTMQVWINTAPATAGFGSSNIQTVSVCPAGSSYDFDHRRLVRQGATGTWSGWVDQQTIHENIPQGARLDAEGRVRCTSPYISSPWTATVTANTVKPIVTPAAPVEMQAWIFSAAPMAGFGASHIVPAACATGTTTEYNHRRMVRQGATGSWGAWRAEQDIKENIPQGARLDAEGQTRCTTPWASSAWSAVRNANTVKPIVAPAAPVEMQAWIFGDAPMVGFGASNIMPAACATGTTTEYNHRRMVRQGATGSWGAWRNQQGITENIPDGARLDAEGQTRCTTPWANSAWSPVRNANTVKGIPTPSTPQMQAWIFTDAPYQNSGTSNIVPAAACPAGTSIQYNHRRMARQGATGNWSSWQDAQTLHGVIPVGTRVDAEGQTRCVTSWTTSNWSGVATNYTVRPIPAPATPQMQAWIWAGGSSNGFGASNIVPAACPSGTSVGYEHRRMVRQGATGSWGSWRDQQSIVENIGQGARLDAEGRTRCSTPWANSGWSSNASNDTVKAITNSPNLSNWNAVIDSGSWVGHVAVDVANCPSGTSYQGKILVRKNHQDSWSEGSWGAVSSGRAHLYTSSTTFGQGDRFLGGGRLRCGTNWTVGPESSGYHAAWVNRPITTAPTLSNWNAIINSSNDYRGRVGVDVAGCPAGTRYDGQILVRRNEEGDWTSGSWGSVATGATRVGIDTVSSTWGQGERLLGGARIRCVSDFTTGPEAAGYHAEWQIRAITSQPTANVYVSRDGGNTYAGVNNLSSCPSISYARWRFADQENNGAWSGWSSWYTANGSYFARSIGYGSYTRASFNLQCVSAYTTGPVGTDAATSSTRPYPAPSAPSGVGGSVTRACNNSWWGGTVSWNSMSYATSYTVTVSWLNSSGNRVSKTMGSTSNTSMGISNTGAHWQPPTVLATVRASNGSGGNTTSNVSIPTVAGCRT